MNNFFSFFLSHTHFQDEEIEELSSKPDSQVVPQKRKLSMESTNNTSVKKIILNRKPALEEIKNDQIEKDDNKHVKISEVAPPEKKIIKLSQLGIKEVLKNLYNLYLKSNLFALIICYFILFDVFEEIRDESKEIWRTIIRGSKEGS